MQSPKIEDISNADSLEDFLPRPPKKGKKKEASQGAGASRAGIWAPLRCAGANHRGGVASGERDGSRDCSSRLAPEEPSAAVAVEPVPEQPRANRINMPPRVHNLSAKYEIGSLKDFALCSLRGIRVHALGRPGLR